MTNSKSDSTVESMASVFGLTAPNGFCVKCTVAMETGNFLAISLEIDTHVRLVGLHCPHEQCMAIGMQVGCEDINNWRTQSPATQEKLLEMMDDIAAEAEKTRRRKRRAAKPQVH